MPSARSCGNARNGNKRNAASKMERVTADLLDDEGLSTGASVNLVSRETANLLGCAGCISGKVGLERAVDRVYLRNSAKDTGKLQCADAIP